MLSAPADQEQDRPPIGIALAKNGAEVAVDASSAQDRRNLEVRRKPLQTHASGAIKRRRARLRP